MLHVDTYVYAYIYIYIHIHTYVHLMKHVSFDYIVLQHDAILYCIRIYLPIRAAKVLSRRSYWTSMSALSRRSDLWSAPAERDM